MKTATTTRQRKLWGKDAEQVAMEWLESIYRGVSDNVGQTQRVIPRNVYFTREGMARLASVLGYVRAVFDLDGEKGIELAIQFLSRLEYVVGQETVELEGSEGGTVEVPGRKAILHDDGSQHGFGIAWFVPVSPRDYQCALNRTQEELEAAAGDGEEVDPWAASNAVSERLRIREKVNGKDDWQELTERRHTSSRIPEWVRYRYIYNGGLLYHGNPDRSLAVRLVDDGNPWSIHT